MNSSEIAKDGNQRSPTNVMVGQGE